MSVLIYRLVLVVEECRRGEEPVRVVRMDWGPDELPGRFYFVAAIEKAYASIELPYFPSAAWVEITTAFRSFRFEAAEPENEAMVGAALWNAVVVTSTGYDL